MTFCLAQTCESMRVTTLGWGKLTVNTGAAGTGPRSRAWWPYGLSACALPGARTSSSGSWASICACRLRPKSTTRPGRGIAMTRFLRPSVVLPMIVSAAFLIVLLALGDVKMVIALLLTFQHLYLLPILLVLVAYEAVQCIQWHVLLRALGIRVPLRAQAFAYLVGEPTRVLPIGNFVENYVLLRAEGTDFGLSSAATLLSILIEVGVALLG